jgi:hypothetical protein
MLTARFLSNELSPNRIGSVDAILMPIYDVLPDLPKLSASYLIASCCQFAWIFAAILLAVRVLIWRISAISQNV